MIDRRRRVQNLVVAVALLPDIGIAAAITLQDIVALAAFNGVVELGATHDICAICATDPGVLLDLVPIPGGTVSELHRIDAAARRRPIPRPVRKEIVEIYIFARGLH